MLITKRSAKNNKKLIYVCDDKTLYLLNYNSISKAGFLEIIAKDLELFQVCEKIEVVKTRKDIWD